MNTTQLRSSIAALPPLGPIPPGQNWIQRRDDLRQKIMSHDPGLFLRWPSVVNAMFVGDCPYVRREFAELSPRFRDALDEPRAGSPDVMELDGVTTSGNLIHQAFHLQSWEEASGRRLDQVGSIAEFGGGYGAMALLVRRLGFTGSYVIHDLPEFAALQRFYLSVTGAADVMCRSELPVAPEAVDCVIGICSLSEVPRQIRDRFMAAYPANAHLVRYAPYWDNEDIQSWADGLMASRPDLRWSNWASASSSDRWYLVSSPK